MKQLYAFAITLMITVSSFAQGNIDQITVSPANPTIADNIVVYVDSWFSSGGCPLDGQYHYLNVGDIDAGAHHCLGLLTVICNATDTFELGQLAAGTYSFNMSLTTGGGEPPCTPGIAVDDTDSLTFTVSDLTGIHETELHNLKIENPVSGQLNFSYQLKEAVQLFDITGKQVGQASAGTRSLNLFDLNPGIYFLRSDKAVRKIIVQ